MTGLLSKQVLPVYDKPMIYYPLSVLMLARISEILVISSPEHLPQIRETILRIGNLGVEFEFISQPRPEGIAQALILGEEFLDGSPCALILGDNIFFGDGFCDVLRRAGWELRIKKPKRFSDGTSKADWDMGIAMEALEYRERAKHVVLVSGDGDFAPLIRRLQKSGQQVEVASFAEGLAGEAREVANRVILLDKSSLEA